MADTPKSNVEEIAKKSWGMAQRVGMQIAALPLDKREEAFAKAKQSLEESARDMGIAGDQMDGFIKLQMEAIRSVVQNIDVGGAPQGGKA